MLAGTNIDGLVQGKRNSSVLSMELRIFFLLTYRYGNGRVPKIREIGTQRVNIIGSAQILVHDINSIYLPNLQYQSFSVIDRRPH